METINIKTQEFLKVKEFAELYDIITYEIHEYNSLAVFYALNELEAGTVRIFKERLCRET